ncbi:MAG TPA: PQQ-binding-like beta-propeller repeat protein [Bryobacteraceae bacterium]|jgi:outer membrane protein assembly factor BamB
MNREFTKTLVLTMAGSLAVYGQGRPLDWPNLGGDAQRSGWEKVDTRITRDNVKDFQLVMKRKLGNGPLTPPAIIGLLISYRGFKELAFVAGGGSNEMWAIDADLDRVFWSKHFDGAAASGACGATAASPALIPPTNFAARRPPGGPRPTVPPAAASSPARPTGRGILGAGGFGAPRPVFGVSGDGKLHLMNTSTGDDVVPAIPFLPPNASRTYLTVVDNTVYTVTSPDCSAGSGAVWALDLNNETAKAVSYPLKGGPVSGFAMGTNGAVYVQTSEALLALSPKVLKLQQSFASGAPASKAASPVVFAYKGRDVIATAGEGGRVYLLDSKSLGGDDHKTPLAQSDPVGSGEITGGLSTWLDGGTRWLLAPVWGSSHGSIVAFKVEDKDGKTVLTKAWESGEMNGPEPAVITAGVVFALASGAQNSGHATLYAFDGTTGKQIYSTGDQVTAPASLNGVTLANGRVFFSTTDGTLYAFGIYLER